MNFKLPQARLSSRDVHLACLPLVLSAVLKDLADLIFCCVVQCHRDNDYERYGEGDIEPCRDPGLKCEVLIHTLYLFSGLVCFFCLFYFFGLKIVACRQH